MTIAEAIRRAQRWQESDPMPDGCSQRDAHAYTYALLMLDIERQAAMQLLADLGAVGETICDRIKSLAAMDRVKS